MRKNNPGFREPTNSPFSRWNESRQRRLSRTLFFRRIFRELPERSFSRVAGNRPVIRRTLCKNAEARKTDCNRAGSTETPWIRCTNNMRLKKKTAMRKSYGYRSVWSNYRCYRRYTKRGTINPLDWTIQNVQHSERFLSHRFFNFSFYALLLVNFFAVEISWDICRKFIIWSSLTEIPFLLRRTYMSTIWSPYFFLGKRSSEMFLCIN